MSDNMERSSVRASAAEDARAFSVVIILVGAMSGVSLRSTLIIGFIGSRLHMETQAQQLHRHSSTGESYSMAHCINHGLSLLTSTSGLFAVCWLGSLPFLFRWVSLCTGVEAVDVLLWCAAFHLFSKRDWNPGVSGVQSHATYRRDCVRCGAHLRCLCLLLAQSLVALRYLSCSKDRLSCRIEGAVVAVTRRLGFIPEAFGPVVRSTMWFTVVGTGLTRARHLGTLSVGVRGSSSRDSARDSD